MSMDKNKWSKNYRTSKLSKSSNGAENGSPCRISIDKADGRSRVHLSGSRVNTELKNRKGSKPVQGGIEAIDF